MLRESLEAGAAEVDWQPVLASAMTLQPPLQLPPRCLIPKAYPVRSQSPRAAEEDEQMNASALFGAGMRRLVDSNIVGVLIWDLDGRILEANDAFLDMLQYGRDDAWKGAKWIRKIDFLAEEKIGFWEVRGYSNSADSRR
jgi:PAS domain-containing protein